ncbi:chorismate mutase [Crossiella sp. CA-258035]|uniref:chorismate mutase n=1 Tax=unclassified Crossiella TaxID=2620835 RepID=UPI002112C864|nr:MULTISPECIES: chorismate mutase [unclassified Crossiella]WHT18810.1 chorismate mutase [Crossiella sp. CA-258035]
MCCGDRDSRVSPPEQMRIAMNAALDSDAQSTSTETDIDSLREEIDHLDSEILRLIQRRTEVSQTIGAARMAAGGPKIVYSREMAVLARFRELGPEGKELAMILLRLGRGRLGR